MLADWSKLDIEVACINNRLDLCRRVEALREVSVSLFLCLFWCLFPTLVFSVCACRHANRRQRRREDTRDKQRQCEAGSGSGLLALLRFVLLGRAQLESQTTPPFSPHQQKCIHLDTNTHMRSQTGSFTESSLAPLFHSQWIQLLFSKETGAFGCSLSFFGPSGGVLRPRHS